jgi:alpha-tubulin suppressor-like RCC1 family protein
VRKVDYTVWCWGSNMQGRLGRGTYNGVGIDPTEIVGLDDVRQLSLNGSHTCATNAARKAYCWGNNSHKQLGVINYSGTPDHRERPTRVPNISDVVEIDVGVARDRTIASGSGFTCARKLDRSIWCWGRNDRGQLGDGTTTDRRVPRKISFP